MAKYSRKREAIIKQLSCRGDHPTAETLYAELKETVPDLSMATVYRNLKQLEEWGEIMKISTDGATRYDANAVPHSHFFCRACGGVTDLDCDIEAIFDIGRKAGLETIEGCSANFYGICSECKGKHS